MVGADLGGAERAGGPWADGAAAPASSWRDWRAVHDRRVHAARLARRLQPAADALGGFASSRLRVRPAGRAERRPAAAIVRGAPPADGIVPAAPELVVLLAPGDPVWWLDAGAAAVWVLGPDGLAVHAGGPVRMLGPEEAVAVGGLRLSVADLLRAGGHRVPPRR